ncbi:hypothetical protein AAHC03_0429 [Spirometra sp. Aus1]
MATDVLIGRLAWAYDIFRSMVTYRCVYACVLENHIVCRLGSLWRTLAKPRCFDLPFVSFLDYSAAKPLYAAISDLLTLQKRCSDSQNYHSDRLQHELTRSSKQSQPTSPPAKVDARALVSGLLPLLPLNPAREHSAQGAISHVMTVA